MHLFFRFAYVNWLYISIPFFILIFLIRYYYARVILYQFPQMAFVLKKLRTTFVNPASIVLSLRSLLLGLLLLLMAKPQLVDQKSKVTVEGIDIMMVLDISGSMMLFDDINDRRPRITIAKEQAIEFIKKRHNDAIGLVVFGNYAMTKCPLTPDKAMLQGMIDSIVMDENDEIHQGTVISQAVITGARRLHSSKAASKIMIVLTDGAPSQNDLPPDQAIIIAQQFGIKVYTIGIGSHGTGMQYDPFGRVVAHQNHFNTDLLQQIADQTGGKFFDAKKIQDVARIYDEIDMLEKTKYQDTVYTRYHDYFLPFIWISLLLIFSELILSTFVWVLL